VAKKFFLNLKSPNARDKARFPDKKMLFETNKRLAIHIPFTRPFSTNPPAAEIRASPLQNVRLDKLIYMQILTAFLLVCDQSSGASPHPLQIIPNGNHQHLPVVCEEKKIEVVPRTYDIYLIIICHQRSNGSAS
jgi:hypothetical protein